MPSRFKRLHSRKQRGPVFVFVASATIAGLLGHGALLASLRCQRGTEWKAPTAPELVRDSADRPDRLAMNGER
jgi:hypothetical protein